MRVGDELAPLEIPVTRTLIVAGAIASRDYQDVHHDAELAGQKGSPDIFMNILTTNGLVGRYITDHFGPAAVLRKVTIRLGVPNYPGDTMVLTGRVTAVTSAVTVPARAATVVTPAGAVTASYADDSRADEAPGATGTDDTPGRRVVEVAVVGINGLGRHVTGTVTVGLPPGARTPTGVAA